jgi:hypothetical protein
MPSEMEDKRTDPRFGPLVIKAETWIEEEHQQGYLTNVSMGGAFLAIDSPPPIGATLALRALLPWKIGELRAEAEVVWRSEAATAINGVGLRFTQLDDGSLERLRAYLERFSDLAAQLES